MRRFVVISCSMIVVSLLLLAWFYRRGSDPGIDRSSQSGEVVPQPDTAETWTKIYTLCEGEGREYIHSEVWQDGKKLDQMTPIDRADLGPDHQIKVRIVPPLGLEPKNFSRDADVLIKEGESFFGELKCDYRVKFTVPTYQGFRILDISGREVGGCVYGDNSSYNDKSHTTDPDYCQVFLPGPGTYGAIMVNARDCLDSKQCAISSQVFDLTKEKPRVTISTAPSSQTTISTAPP